VTTSTPDTLYYWCQNHLNMGNSIVVDLPGTGSGAGGGDSASILVSDTQPSSASDGTLWFDSDDQLLYVFLESSGTFVRPKPVNLLDLGIDEGTDGQLLSTDGDGGYTFIIRRTIEVA